jgi:predicted ATPase/DNA-binding XRE family transcriptional regulator
VRRDDMSSEGRDLIESADPAASAQPEVSKLLRAYRGRSGLSQTQLAELARMSPAAVGALEQGSRRAPYRQTIELLANALGLSSDERAGLEAAANRARGKARPISPDAEFNRSTLPLRFTPFIERDETLEIASLLRTNRLITITGFAGVGKTRTALEVAKLQTGEDVFFIDLSASKQSDFIIGELASIFDVPLGAGPELDSVIKQLKSRRCLLIVDNCEHLIDDASAVINAILRSCLGITILATSREQLGLSAELVYRLPPLALPPLTQTSDDGRQYAALELFIARTQAADIHFSFGPEGLKIASDICRQLDGIPLAIELAAAHAPLLGLPALRKRLRGLAAPKIARDRPARHQTMLTALHWSYDLLDDAEKTLLLRTSIFAGGFTLAAAEDVCSDKALPADVISGLIFQLASKSLVDITYHEGDARYRLLELIRVFGVEKLSERNETETFARKHVRWAVEYARSLHLRKIASPKRPQELENLRTAVRYCLASPHEEDAATAGDIIGMGRHLWFRSDRFLELRQLIDEALSRIDESTHQGTVAILLGAVCGILPPYRRTEAQRKAVSLLTATGEFSGAVALSSILAVFLHRSGQFEAANDALREAERLLTIGVTSDRDKALLALQSGWISSEQGDVSRARRHLLEADRFIKSMDDDSLLPTRSSLAAEIEAVADNLAAAVAIYQAFMEVASLSGRWAGEVSASMDTYAICHLLLGNIDAAVAAARLGHPRWREQVSLGQADGFVDAVAFIGVVRDHSISSARLTAAANAQHSDHGTLRTSIARRAFEITQVRLAGQFSKSEISTHYEYGSQMSNDQIFE